MYDDFLGAKSVWLSSLVDHIVSSQEYISLNKELFVQEKENNRAKWSGSKEEATEQSKGNFERVYETMAFKLDLERD